MVLTRTLAAVRQGVRKEPRTAMQELRDVGTLLLTDEVSRWTGLCHAYVFQCTHEPVSDRSSQSVTGLASQ